MTRGLSLVRHGRFVVLRGLLLLIVMAGLIGCVPPTAQTSPQPIVCTPQSPKVNIYRTAPQPWANKIFEAAFPSNPISIPPTEQQILDARYAAFLQLLGETKRWSDTEIITLADSSKISITLTFISPELFQAVFLNEVLKNRFPTSGFQDQLQSALNAVAERDELLFLLTVTTANNNINPTRHTIKIPIRNITLNNAEDLKVFPRHDDHNLDQPIDTSLDPVFGYIAYPFALLSGSQCKWILDPKYNTNIVITLPFVEVDGVSNNNANSWTIPYISLINPIMPSNTAVPTLPSGFDQTLYPMTPLTLPPIDHNQANYWQDFARFIWNQITLGNY